jgi:hypothetical protein
MIIAVLVFSNIISYKFSQNYFSKVNAHTMDDVKVENSVLGSGSRIIGWAKEILRFFRNP